MVVENLFAAGLLRPSQWLRRQKVWERTARPWFCEVRSNIGGTPKKFFLFPDGLCYNWTDGIVFYKQKESCEVKSSERNSERDSEFVVVQKLRKNIGFKENFVDKNKNYYDAEQHSGDTKYMVC